MSTLGCGLLFIGFSTVAVVLIHLVHDWLQLWFRLDPDDTERMTRIYEGGIRRFR